MKELTLREKKAMDTRLNIIQSGLELLKEQDVDAVTIRDISNKANVSIGAIYHHFDSKDDIINSGYLEFDHWLERVFEEDEHVSSVENIQRLIGLQMKFTSMNGVNLPKYVFKAQLNAENKLILDKSRFFYQTLLRLVQKGIEAKEIDSATMGEAEQAADAILRLSRGVVYDWCLNDGRYDLIACCHKDLERLLRY